MDAPAVLAQIRMHRQVNNSAFILLEGIKDELRFRKFFQPDAMLIVCNGKDNVIKIIYSLHSHENGVLGFIDADFDVLEEKRLDHKNLIYSNFHDFEIDFIFSSAFQRYLIEVADKQKLSCFGGYEILRTTILTKLMDYSCFKLINKRRNLGTKFRSIKIQRCFDKELTFKKNEFLVLLANNCGLQAKIISQMAEDVALLKIDHSVLPHLISGHDFCCLLGIALKEKVGARAGHTITADELELHLRLTLDIADFREVGLENKVRAWGAVNPGYDVL